MSEEQTPNSGELTEEELAAIDAEIAAELDAEESGELLTQWFVVHSYSGMENKVKRNIEHRGRVHGHDRSHCRGCCANRDRN